MINVYQRGGHTMGDTLIAMSLFNSLNQPVNLTTSPESLYNRWKDILNINEQITITIDNYCPLYQNPPHPRFLESFKVFNQYIKPDSVQLFGQQFTTGRRGKRGVAVLINNGDQIKNSDYFELVTTTREYPYIKFHPWELYEKILLLVQAAGYDPYIIDNKNTSVENKIFILNELCDFVIGYEGGLCHLAHTLRLPTIILPWRTRLDEINVTDFLHLDKQTYFVRDTSEIFGWSPEYLTNLVDGLYHEEGFNNQWMTVDSFPDSGPFIDYYYTGSSDQFRQQYEWVIQYMDKKTLGGY